MEPVEVIIKKEEKPWYKNSLVVIPLLLFFPYIGIPWVWKFTDYSGPLKVILTGMELFAIIYFSARYNTLWFIIILIVSSVILNKFVDSELKWKGGDNMKKKIILGVIGVIILFAVISAIGGSKSSSTQTAPQVATQQTDTQSSPQAQASTQPKDVTPKVGDVTKLGDREFTVNSVRRSKAMGYSTPKAGKEYVIVNVTIRNLGKDEVSYNPYDFKVQDANGAQESSTYASLDDDLNSGTLAPGGKVTGSMPFEVPVGDEAKLIFQPSFWSNQRVVVDLGNK